MVAQVTFLGSGKRYSTECGGCIQNESDHEGVIRRGILLVAVLFSGAGAVKHRFEGDVCEEIGIRDE
jgi:hypothetical protein